MPIQGQHDQFENTYMQRLNYELSFSGGIPVQYPRDNAAIDTGLHLFVKENDGDYNASQSRVWFQGKGIRKSTMSAEAFDNLEALPVRVQVDHLKYWNAAPEPVYLAVFIESKNLFIIEDVRAVVDRMWPSGDFYESLMNQETVTLCMNPAAVLNHEIIQAMFKHRSMRIDGPAFQGRPLGHRYDPLRSELSIVEPQLWREIVEKLLGAYRFRELGRTSVSRDLTVLTGQFYDTMQWQSGAWAEFGFSPETDHRINPPVDYIHGEAAIAIDAMPDRPRLLDDELSALNAALPAGTPVVVFFFGKELSEQGGTWRNVLRARNDRNAVSHLIGTESVTNMVLVATLVYLDLAPKLSFRFVNYLY
jgi:hypothetical protein